MTVDNPKTENENLIINLKNTTELINYYCPFCNHKLFRGKVATYTMVCSSCNKLVRSPQDDIVENEEQL